MAHVPTTPEEYRKRILEIESKLSSFAKLVGGITTLDERIDITNLLLIETAAILARIEYSLGITEIITISRQNPEHAITQQKTVTTAGTAEQLPPLHIPFDHAVSIKALPTNTGTVYIAESKLNAEDHTKAYPLEASDAIEYKIRDLSVLWVDVEVSGEGVVWTTEYENI